MMSEVSRLLQQNQQEIETFLDQMVIRAQTQEYTENYSNAVLLLLQEALQLLREVPANVALGEWTTERDRFIAKVTQRIGDDQWPKKK
jgi:hypothetical protein